MLRDRVTHAVPDKIEKEQRTVFLNNVSAMLELHPPYYALAIIFADVKSVSSVHLKVELSVAWLTDATSWSTREYHFLWLSR